MIVSGTLFSHHATTCGGPSPTSRLRHPKKQPKDRANEAWEKGTDIEKYENFIKNKNKKNTRSRSDELNCRGLSPRRDSNPQP